MMPSCDQTGVPIHFHSSTTAGSACLISVRILLRVSPRQSPRSAILFEMSSEAGWPRLAPDFFILSSYDDVLSRDDGKQCGPGPHGGTEVEDRQHADGPMSPRQVQGHCAGGGEQFGGDERHADAEGRDVP